MSFDERNYIGDVYRIFEDNSFSGRAKRLKLEQVGIESVSDLIRYVDDIYEPETPESREILRKLVGSKVTDIVLAYIAGKNFRP